MWKYFPGTINPTEENLMEDNKSYPTVLWLLSLLTSLLSSAASFHLPKKFQQEAKTCAEVITHQSHPKHPYQPIGVANAKT